jgi:hypothetical protein
VPQGPTDFAHFIEPLTEADAAANHAVAEKVFSAERKQRTIHEVIAE